MIYTYRIKEKTAIFLKIGYLNIKEIKRTEFYTDSGEIWSSKISWINGIRYHWKYREKQR